MLARVRAATADIGVLPEVPRRYNPGRRGPGSADEALVSRFEERASDYGLRCAAVEQTRSPRSSLTLWPPARRSG